MDLISAVSSLAGLIEKIVTAFRSHHSDKRMKSNKILEQTKEVLSDISMLIEKFGDSIDVVLSQLEPTREKGLPALLSGDLLRANRRLFEIATDMRILTKSIKKRFPNADIPRVSQVTDGCMQIVAIESYTLSLFPNSALKELPIHPYDRLDKLCHMGIYPDVIASLAGPPKACHEAIAYFNDLILQLTRCKEQVAMALLEIE